MTEDCPANIDLMKPVNLIEGEDAIDTELLREMAIEACDFISSQEWCERIDHQYLTFGIGGEGVNQTSVRSRNQAKNVRPILLNNACPNAVHSQQFGFIPGCGRSDTKQHSIAKDLKCRNSPALGLT